MEENNFKELAVHCGTVNDSYEQLVNLCKKEAEKLSASMDIQKNETVSVSFWCGDQELVCVGRFRKNDNGAVEYQLDFDESTL